MMGTSQPSTFPQTLEPCLDGISFRDPRNPENYIPVVAFYFPGKDEPVDEICRSGFLGNFTDLGPDELFLQPPGKHGASFRNAEAAFQACKLWNWAHEFRYISGDEAFRKKKALYRFADLTYAGYGNNWQAMYYVLRAKFTHGSCWTEALLKTGDAFLLEHNSAHGRDSWWSDDLFGEGKNWLGVLLMMVRDYHRVSSCWYQFLARIFILDTGEFANEEQKEKWQNIVMDATARTCLQVQKRQYLASQTPAAARTPVHHATPPQQAQPPPQEPPATTTKRVQEDVHTWASTLDDLPYSSSHCKRRDCRPFSSCSTSLNGAIALDRGDIQEQDVDLIVVPLQTYTWATLPEPVQQAYWSCSTHAVVERPVITEAKGLKASYVMHAAWVTDEDLDYTCLSALDAAFSHGGVTSVALPSLFFGLGTCAVAVAHVALASVRKWMTRNPEKLDLITFVTKMDRDSEIYRQLIPYHFPRPGDYECMEEDDNFVHVKVTWKGDAHSVRLSGKHNGWVEYDGMHQDFSSNCFYQVLRLAKGFTHEYKFIVDGHWKTRDDQPKVKDSEGRENNVMDLRCESKPSL